MFPISAVPAVDFFSTIRNDLKSQEMSVPIFLGVDERGEEIWFDLIRNPHLLIAGSTGSGKSTMLHSLMANILLSSGSHIFLIDTKGLEFQEYGELDRVQIIDNYSDACDLLMCLIQEMEYRYILLRMKKLGYHVSLPKLVLLIDEYADLSLQDGSKKLYHQLLQLTQKCRGAEIYCTLATQRPSADILKPSIKANFAARIACQVGSCSDSRIILDSRGAENLVGRGQAIIRNYNHEMVKFQSPMVSAKEVIDHLQPKSGIKRTDGAFTG